MFCSECSRGLAGILGNNEVIVLSVLSAEGSNKTQLALSREEIMTKGDLTIFKMSQSITRLEFVGLIKQPYVSGKSKRYYITPEGEKVLGIIERTV